MPASAIAELTPRRGGAGHDGTFSAGGDGNGDSGVPERAYFTGMLLALSGIFMFFMALVSAWIVRKGLSSDWQPIVLPRILWFNTVILIASSFSLARSRWHFSAGRDADHRHWWGIATILGLFFLAGQLAAWRQLFAAGIFLASNPSSSFFYVFTAAHGLHVFGGIIALVVIAGSHSRRIARAAVTRVAALYWHSLGALWLIIFGLFLVQG